MMQALIFGFKVDTTTIGLTYVSYGVLALTAGVNGQNGFVPLFQAGRV